VIARIVLLAALVAAPPGNAVTPGAAPRGGATPGAAPPTIELRVISEREVLTPPEPVDSITFGEIVAFAGDEAIVTGAVVGRPGVDRGRIATFVRNDGAWRPRDASIVVAGIGRRDIALRSVAAGPAVIAASFHRGASDAGSVLLFQRELVESGWALSERLEAPSFESAPEFGGVIATDGALVAVSEVDPGFSAIARASRPSSPRVHLYERRVDGWNAIAAIDAPRSRPAPWFGTALAIDGPLVVVGSPKQKSPASSEPDAPAPEGAPPSLEPAQVRIHRRSGEAWALDSTIAGASVTPWPGFGTQVAIEGDLLAVTATEERDGGGSKVFVFRRGGSGWTSEGELVPRNVIPAGSFGASLAISRGRVLVGDTHALIPGADQTGLVHGFERIDGRWIETFRLQPRAPAMPTSFGSHLAVRGDLAIVNRTRSESRGCPLGGAYLFELPEPSAK